jgi:hypothetical protein
MTMPSIIDKVSVGRADKERSHLVRWRRVVPFVILIGVVCALILQTDKAMAQKAGYSLRFYGHGVDDIDRVKVPIDPSVPADVGATDFTIEWWMKAAAADNTPGDCGDWICGNIIFDRDIYEPGISGFGISLYNGNIWFGSGDPIVTIKAAVNVADNAWHHIAVTRIRDTGEQCIFVDGTLDVCGTAAPGDISYPDGFRNEWPNNPYLVIGAEKHDYDQIIGQDPPQYPSYNGWIDEVRLSDVVRYTSGFESPSGPFTSDGNTVALYHLDEGPIGACTGTMLDSSGASGDPSQGMCNYGGADPAGPVYTTDIPFENGTTTSTSTPTSTSTSTATPTATATATVTDTSTPTATRATTPTQIIQDTTPPSISNVAASPMATEVVITWDTDEPATSQITYGAGTTLILSTTESIEYTTSHRIVLANLSPDTAYAYAVRSTDEAGNTGVSAVFDFRTLASEDAIHIYLPLVLRSYGVTETNVQVFQRLAVGLASAATLVSVVLIAGRLRARIRRSQNVNQYGGLFF